MQDLLPYCIQPARPLHQLVQTSSSQRLPRISNIRPKPPVNMFLPRYHSAPSWGPRLPSVLMPREAELQTSTTDVTNTFKIWIIIAVVTTFLTFSACITLIAITISKRQMVKQQLEEARTSNTCLDEKDFGKRRWMAADGHGLDAESTREHIIRKSLASRSGRSDRSSSTASSTSRPGTGSDEGLKYDWKDLESRLSRQGSLASLQKSNKSPFPDLPAPTLSRSTSGRTHTELPPLLEQHPCLRDSN